MEVKREYYLNQLISHKHNGLIKIISGIRRCGKSYLLSELFRKHLLAEGIKENHIIHIALDDYEKKQYRNPDNCYQYVKSSIKDDEMYYLLLDEVQMMDSFEDVLNGFLHIKNLDVYVTGSNSKFLSSDVVTEFRGRGDEIRVYIHLFEINEFSYIKLSETLGFPYIHTRYIFLKRAKENKTNNHKKGLILLLVCVSYRKHLYFERNSNE